MKEFNKYNSLEKLSKIVATIISTGGMIIGFWDMKVGTYFVVLGIYIYVMFGGKNE